MLKLNEFTAVNSFTFKMSCAAIVFVITCEKCKEEKRDSWFEEEESICVPCKYPGSFTKHRIIRSEYEFRNKIIDMKGEMIGKYINSQNKVKCRCSQGHICNPYPCNIRKGGGMCRICAGNDSTRGEAN